MGFKLLELMAEAFDYEKVCMAVRKTKPADYKIPFSEDYRFYSLYDVIPQGKIKILDIGCGGGIFTESLPYYFPQAEIYGCDISKSAIDNAKQVGSGNIKYNVITKGKLPYKDAFFDFCFSFDVLEHVSDLKPFLSEVRRVMKKEGRYFSITPCEGQKLTYTWLLQKIHRGDKLTFKYFGHIHPEFTHQRLEELLKANKFKVEKKFFSEHWIHQILLVIIYFFPKLLMERVLGEQGANKYSDSGVVRNAQKSFDPMIVVRKLWLRFMRMTRYLMYWEYRVMRGIPHGAWKLDILVSKTA